MFNDLNTFGWIFFVSGWTLVASLTFYCIYKIFKTGNKFEDNPEQ